MQETLQKITALIPEPIRQIGINILGDECYEKLIDQVDFSSTKCIKIGISKGLGIGIVGLSTIVKIPQIMKIISAQSAAGVSFESYALEILAYSISLAYNVRNYNPFSTYGETSVLLIQDIVIAFLILFYSGKKTRSAIYGALYAVLVYYLFSSESCPSSTLKLLQALTIPLGLFSKIPQIISNYKNKSTGQLSAFGVFNYLFGSLARVFTTFQEVDDNLILSSFICGAVLNAILVAQLIMYWGNSLGPKVKRE